MTTDASSAAHGVLTSAQTQVREQAAAQKEKAAGGLRSLSEELRSLADGTAGKPGRLTDLSRDASLKMKNLASWLEAHEPAQLLDELRDFARRKPGGFLLGASAAGAMAGRLSRGAMDASRAGHPAPAALATDPSAASPPSSLKVSPSLAVDRAASVPREGKGAPPEPVSEQSQPSALRGDLA